jgi:DeoR family transcriptional regulator of aga operon
MSRDTMSIAERHKYILEQLNKNGFIKVVPLARELDVTVVTIRKDIKLLEEQNLLFKMHGSAMPVNPHVPDVSVDIKNGIRSTEKNLIGRAAAKLIDANDSIIIASGSTISAFVGNITISGYLNVVTPSLRVAMALTEKEDVRVTIMGGEIHRKSLSVRGEYAARAFEEITCSKLFMGIDGIDPEFGLTTSNVEEARLSKHMMDAATRTIILADSSKFGQRGFGRICSLERIDTIITDKGITGAMQDIIEDAGVRLIIA